MATVKSRTGIYNPTSPRFFVKEEFLSDRSSVFNIWIRRDDGECLVLIETAINERHANALVDDFNAVLELRGVI